MFKEFKAFILRGNVIDLAVAVVIGAAFGTVVSSLVKDVITPLIAAIVGKPDFSNLYFSINHSRVMYGDFINAAISFLMLAFVIFFFVVKPINKMIAYSNRNKIPEDTSQKKCNFCLSEIPIAATVCDFCTKTVK